MLRLEIQEKELFDEKEERFIIIGPAVLTLEHSLLSISKWESIFCKPFISNEHKTPEEILGYIKCMTLSSNVNPMIYDWLSQDQIMEIMNYINNPMSATTFSDVHIKKGPKEILTSELIYYIMVAYQIPFECEKWHFNRLLNLIKICQIKNEPQKKMSKAEVMAQNAKINAERKKALMKK